MTPIRHRALEILSEPRTPKRFGALMWPHIKTTNKRGQPMRPFYAGAYLGKLLKDGLVISWFNDRRQVFYMRKP